MIDARNNIEQTHYDEGNLFFSHFKNQIRV